MITRAIATTVNRYPIFLVTLVFCFAIYGKLIAGEGNESTFRNDVVSGLLVLIAGIPAGLFLDSLRRKKEDEIKQSEDRAQELFILESLIKELTETYSFLNTRRAVINTIVASRINTEVWDTFSSSGKLNYLASDLLFDFASAYNVARKISFLENYAMQSYTMSAVGFDLPDGTRKTGAEILLQQARTFDTEFRDLADKALALASQRVKKIQNI